MQRVQHGQHVEKRTVGRSRKIEAFRAQPVPRKGLSRKERSAKGQREMEPETHAREAADALAPRGLDCQAARKENDRIQIENSGKG